MNPQAFYIYIVCKSNHANSSNKAFKEQYKTVRFELHQRNYMKISNWMKDGTIYFDYTSLFILSNQFTDEIPHTNSQLPCLFIV